MCDSCRMADNSGDCVLQARFLQRTNQLAVIGGNLDDWKMTRGEVTSFLNAEINNRGDLQAAPADVDQQIGPCPSSESRKLITVMALPEACVQKPSVEGVTACARTEVPSTAT